MIRNEPPTLGHDGVAYRNGRKVGYLSDVGGGGWGRRGGLAITGSNFCSKKIKFVKPIRKTSLQ